MLERRQLKGFLPLQWGQRENTNDFVHIQFKPLQVHFDKKEKGVYYCDQGKQALSCLIKARSGVRYWCQIHYQYQGLTNGKNLSIEFLEILL